MGQQQLILLALAVVIVGGAIVVGIRAFSENSVKSNADVMMQDAVRVANDMQAWKQKPAPFGGQASVIGATGGCAAQANVDDAADFCGATFTLLGYQVDSGTGADAVYRNLNGIYQISGQGATGTALITGRNISLQNEIQVGVTGLEDTSIQGTITCLGGTTPAGDACTPAAY